MAGLEVLVAVLGILAIPGAYVVFKDKKMRKKVAVGGLFFAFVGALFGGLAWAGVPAFLSTTPSSPPVAGGLWNVVILDTSDTDRTETELIDPDGKSVLYIMSDVNMDGLGDVDLNLRALNLNEGKTTDIWGGEISIVSVGTVIVSGVPTPVANYTTDRSRFSITYTEDAGNGDVTQVHDRATFSATSKTVEDVSVDIDIDPAVADDVPGGQKFQLVYSVGGNIITCTIQES